MTPTEKLVMQAKELKNNFSYKELATITGLSKSTFYRLLKDHGDPGVRTLIALEKLGMIGTVGDIAEVRYRKPRFDMPRKTLEERQTIIRGMGK